MAWCSTARAWARAALPAWLLLAALLHACGGGVEGQGTGSGYSEGPISGFGSIIVNGIRFDESSATITDENGHALRREDLKLGMTVRIDAGAIDQVRGTAVARDVRVGSDLVGRIATNDLGASTLGLLGQAVRITASTVFDEAIVGGQGGLAVGSTIEVFAILDPVSGVYAAQRVQRVVAPQVFELRGVVASLNTAQHTFRMGAATLSYDARSAPQDLADGQLLRLSLETARDAKGRWVVRDFANGASQPQDGGEAEIESVITDFHSNADFTLSGVPVDAASAQIVPPGATLAAGLRVEVEGSMRGDVLVADKVKVKGGGADGGDDKGRDIELNGRITALDTVARTLVVHDQLVAYAGARFIGSQDEEDLALNKQVEVRGHLSDDGTYVVAEQVKIAK